MFKNTLRFISYLLFSLTLGVVVTFVIIDLENIAEEKKLKKAVEQEIVGAVNSFKEAATSPDNEQVLSFLKKYTVASMKDKVVAVDHGSPKKPANNEFTYLFKYIAGGHRVDLYINDQYVQEQVYSWDMPELVFGFFTTVAAFSFVVFYSEKKRQALQMREQFETKNQELRKALQEQEALALLGQMTATLAHELRTPIATISNLIQVLPSRINDEGFTSRFAVLAKEELNRTHQLIDNLLVYGKEIAATNDEWIPFAQFASDAAAKVNIQVSCAEFSVYGDRFYLRLLFENLMRNSLQAGADAACIKPGGGDDRAEILFEDNGKGFPQDAALNALLNPFITKRSKGAGLGLYLVQKITAAHHGAVSLYRPAQGAGVRITLPKERIRI